ncbi:4754_t:CDS:1 [Ambispora leptoticha]|uniref:4754_t:CDS:1 n=1 Tax=Ambispora leptoticha TaxID=144679 RepID=A0A9N9CCU3_9GLOM|nr:4754_t:CDS:1 [Ambispora leptoticha]
MKTNFTFILDPSGQTSYQEEDFNNPPCALYLSIKELIKPEESAEKIPRPLNSFMLFRRNYAASVQILNRGRNFVPYVSTEASQAWECASKEVITFFTALAEKAKLEHKRRYPHYIFSPKRNNNKPTSTQQQDNEGMKKKVPSDSPEPIVEEFKQGCVGAPSNIQQAEDININTNTDGEELDHHTSVLVIDSKYYDLFHPEYAKEIIYSFGDDDDDQDR